MRGFRPGWASMTISRNYLLNLSMVLILMLMTMIVSAWLLAVAGQRVNDAGRQGDRVVQITEIGSLFRSKDTRVVDYLLQPGDEAVRTYSEDQMKLTEAEEGIRPYMNTAEQKKLFSQIMSHDAQSFNLFQNYFVPAVLMKQNEEVIRIRAEQNQIQAETMQLLDQLRASVVDEQRSAVNRARMQIQWAIGLMAGALFLSVVLSLAVTMRIQRRIRKSFDRVLQMTGRISSGDLSGKDEPVHEKDELGLIAESTVRMKQNLVTIIEAIVKMSAATKSSSRLLIQSVHRITATSGDVRQAMAEFSEGIDGQAKHAAQISDVTQRFMDQLSSEVSRAQEINEQSATALDASEQGKTSVNRSIETMQGIHDSVSAAMEKLDRLEKRTRDISKLIGFIRGVAGQTNLLAINATIESAHAGEAGAGFAVIADSIRSLSNQTSASVKEMSAMLHSIRTETETTVVALQSSCLQVEEGMKQICMTDRQYHRADEQMQLIGGSIRDMSEQLGQIGDLGKTIRQSIESIAAVTEASASSVGDVVLSMDQVNGTVNTLAEDADSLAESARSLEEMTKKFTL